MAFFRCGNAGDKTPKITKNGTGNLIAFIADNLGISCTAHNPKEEQGSGQTVNTKNNPLKFGSHMRVTFTPTYSQSGSDGAQEHSGTWHLVKPDGTDTTVFSWYWSGSDYRDHTSGTTTIEVTKGCWMYCTATARRNTSNVSSTTGISKVTVNEILL